MKLTLDASVHLSALASNKAGSSDCRELLRRIHGQDSENRSPQVEVLSPTLLIIEVTSSVARALDDPSLAAEVTQVLRRLPGQTMIPLSELLAEETSKLAAEQGLRTADALYGAVAQLYGSILVTLDPNQWERLSRVVSVWRPEEALRQLNAVASS